MKRNIYLLFTLLLAICCASCKNDRLDQSQIANNDTEQDALISGDGIATLRYGKPILGKVIIKIAEEHLNDMQISEDGEIQLRSVPSMMSTALNKINASKAERYFRIDPRFEQEKRDMGMHLWYEVTIDESTDMVMALQTLSQVPGIECVEYEPEMMMLGEPIVPYFLGDYQKRDTKLPFNDPRLKEQWHYNNTATANGWKMGADVNLFKAWEVTTGKADVVVCVVDGGVSLEHEDLKDNLWINEAELHGEKGKDDDGNGFIDDIYGYNFVNESGTIVPDEGYHGTHVAGTVAARNNNGIGVCGVAGGDHSKAGTGVRIMSANVFAGKNQGGFAKAIVYGADNGALISQNSWGNRVPGPTPGATKVAIDYFRKNAGRNAKYRPNALMEGGVVIIAAGNDSSEERYAPGEYEPAITVNAMGPDYKKAGYSNYGTWTDITAPGGNIDRYGTKAGVLSSVRKAEYAFYQGTSMACPHVSGVAALAISAHGGPNFTAKELEEILLASVLPVDIDEMNPEYAGKLGSGYIDAYQAVTIKNKHKNPDTPKFLPEKSKGDKFQEITVYWQVPKDEDDETPSKYRLYCSKEQLTESNYATVGQPLGNALGFVSAMGLAVGEEISYTASYLDHSSTYYFALVAVDRWGLQSKPTFMTAKTKTNNLPVISNIPKEPIVLLDINGSTDYLLEVNEPDGQTWKFKTSGHTSGVNCTKTDKGIKVSIRPVLSEGEYKFGVEVVDELGGKSTYEVPFRIVSVDAPEITSALPSVLIGVENEPLTADLSKNVKPQGMLKHTYKASSSNGTVASVTVEGSKVTVKGHQPGKATINVTVSNGYYETRTSFDVSVTKNKDNDVYAVWPLPLKDKLNFWVKPNSGKPVVTISTLAGEKVIDRALLVDHEGMASVPVKSLAPGSYRLRVTAGGKEALNQVVQKR